MKQFNNKRIFKTLKVQIALYFLITSLVLIMLVGSVFYFSTSSIILSDKLDSTKASVEQSGQYIEVYIEKLKVLADLIASNTDTKMYLSKQNQISHSRVMSLIGNILSSDKSLVSIVIVGKNGTLLSNEISLDMSVSEDMMKEEWYVGAINSDHMPVLTSARQQKFSMDKESWVISISQEIVDEKGENIGVVLLDIKYQVLEDYLKNMNLGKHGYGFIINSDMNVVYHPDTSYFENQGKKEELLMISKKNIGYDKTMGMLTHHYEIEKTNWTLVGLSSLDDLYIIRRQILEMLFFASFILFVIVIGGGLFMAGRITNPIKNLESAMLNFEEGMEKIEIDEKGCYEVVSLGQHFNKMIDEIKVLMAAIKDNEKYLRSYELNALHSQINPHFLYNTLDTIVWMAEFDDSEKVIAVTKSLAQFFRISLSKGKEKISLGDEIEHAKQYLFIQKQRYEEQLSYSIDIDENLKSIEVPKIILQPIIENAIYHGIREKDGSGHIDIFVRVMDQKLTITIKDDGVGFDQLKPQQGKVKLGGVGISNVDQRIKLYYGNEYGLDVSSVIGEGTKVEITLPCLQR